MKIAVISDIHANLEALKTALTYIQSQPIEQIICLGDVVVYGPRPNECVEFVRESCAHCLMGNHDHAVLGLTDVYYFNEYAREAVLWSRDQLTPANTAYLDNLPFTHEVGNILFVHSSPQQPDEWHYIFYDHEARQNLDQIRQRLVFVGHSHIPTVYSYNEGEFLQERFLLDLKNDRYIVNVGSIGQPRDGNPKACFVIYDTDSALLEYVRLEYPVKVTYQDIIDRQLPAFLAMRLLSGH